MRFRGAGQRRPGAAQGAVNRIRRDKAADGRRSGMVNPPVLSTTLASLVALVAAKGGGASNNCSNAQWEDGVDFHSEICQAGNSTSTGAADCCAQFAALGPAVCLNFSYKKSDKQCWCKTCDAGRKHDSNIIPGRCHSTGGPGSGGTQVIYAAGASDAARRRTWARPAPLPLSSCCSTRRRGRTAAGSRTALPTRR